MRICLRHINVVRRVGVIVPHTAKIGLLLKDIYCVKAAFCNEMPLSPRMLVILFIAASCESITYFAAEIPAGPAPMIAIRLIFLTVTAHPFISEMMNRLFQVLESQWFRDRSAEIDAEGP